MRQTSKSLILQRSAEVLQLDNEQTKLGHYPQVRLLSRLQTRPL